MYHNLNLKKMKNSVKISILTATVAVALMFLGGCNKDSGTPNLESDSFNGSVAIEAKSGLAASVTAAINIKTKPSFSYVELQDVNYASGKFSFKLPKPPSNELTDIDTFIEDDLEFDGDGKLKYNPSDAKVAYVVFLAWDANDKLAGTFLYLGDDDTLCFFVYANKEVTVTGATNMTVKLEQGWNRLYRSDSGKGFITTKKPAKEDFDWYFRKIQ